MLARSPSSLSLSFYDCSTKRNAKNAQFFFRPDSNNGTDHEYEISDLNNDCTQCVENNRNNSPVDGTGGSNALVSRQTREKKTRKTFVCLKHNA